MSTGEWHGGKGSRPRNVDYETYRKNFDRIFRTPAEDGDEVDEGERADAIGKNDNPVKVKQ